MYLLDTNIFQWATKGKFGVVERILQVPESSVLISSIVAYEVLYEGCFKELEHIKTGKKKQSVEHVYESMSKILEDLRLFRILTYTDEAELYYKKVYDQRERVDRPDWMIASHSILSGNIVITDNTEHFTRISKHMPELRFENWAIHEPNPSLALPVTG